ELRILRRAFNLALKENTLSRSSVPYFELLPEHNARKGFVPKGHFDAILTNLSDNDVRDYVQWGFWTGMRRGEIAKLRWDDLDHETFVLHLPGEHTKNGEARKFALVGIYQQIIKRRLVARVIGCPFIFHRGGKLINEFRKTWKTACKKAGVPGLLFHD